MWTSLLVSYFFGLGIFVNAAPQLKQEYVAFLNPYYQFQQLDDAAARLVLERSPVTEYVPPSNATTSSSFPTSGESSNSSTVVNSTFNQIYITTTVTRFITVELRPSTVPTTVHYNHTREITITHQPSSNTTSTHRKKTVTSHTKHKTPEGVLIIGTERTSGWKNETTAKETSNITTSVSTRSGFEDIETRYPFRNRHPSFIDWTSEGHIISIFHWTVVVCSGIVLVVLL